MGHSWSQNPTDFSRTIEARCLLNWPILINGVMITIMHWGNFISAQHHIVFVSQPNKLCLCPRPGAGFDLIDKQTQDYGFHVLPTWPPQKPKLIVLFSVASELRD